MMKRVLAMCAAVLTAAPLLAARPMNDAAPVRNPTGRTWTKPANLTPEAAAASAARAAEAMTTQGVRPAVLLETNTYTFAPGEKMQLRISLNPNGSAEPVTLFMYWQNRVTGAKTYYSIPAGGLMTDGEIADLLGAPGAPVAINVPTWDDFVLLGSAADPAEVGWGVNGALGASWTVPSGQTGLYQWVIEVRDAMGRQVISRSNAMFSYIESTITLSGDITSNTTLTATNRYVLSDFVEVTEPNVITIEPGTVIYGGDPRASLFIAKGAKIMADGTNMRPIVFTSAQKVGDRAQRDWGGLVLFGRAPINEPGGQAYLEGLPSEERYSFGGTDPHDSSGVIRYVRIEFGGYEIEANQEINGFTPCGVGDATVVDYLQVSFDKDDSVEPFGGTINMKHLLFLSNADDGMDGDLGWQGKFQFMVSIKTPVNDENDSNFGMEWDNHPQDYTLSPRTYPQAYNITAIGTGGLNGIGAYGGVIRRGASCNLHNVIIMGSKNAPLTFRNDETFNQIDAPENPLIFDNSILYGDFSDAKFPNSSDNAAATREFLFTTMTSNRNVDPRLTFGWPWSAVSFMMPDVSPLPGSPALDANYAATPPDDGFFDTTATYIGAIGPGDNWVLSGWAMFSDN